MSTEPALAPRAQLACTACGARFTCDPQGDCWCAHVDVRLPMPAPGATCLCSACLTRAAREAGG